MADKDPDSYVPKDASEESASVSNILSSIRNRLDQPVKSAEKELKEISAIFNNSSNKEKLIKQLQTSVPKSIKSGSVAESLYACIAPSVEGVPSSCVPSCQTSESGVTIGTCSRQVFVKEDDGDLKKHGTNSFVNAYVYIKSSGTSTTRSRTQTAETSNCGLSSRDVDTLKSAGVSEVEVYIEESTGSYKKCGSLNLRKDDTTRYSRNSKCDPSEQICEDEHSYNWLLLIGVVVFVIIVGFFFWRCFVYSAATVATTTAKPELMRAPYSFE